MAVRGTLTRLTQLAPPQLISKNSIRATASATRLFCNSAPAQTDDNNKGKTEQVSKTENQHQTQQKEEQQAEVNGEFGNEKNMAEEVGGPRGPEPTRYGDWERNGRCYDF